MLSPRGSQRCFPLPMCQTDSRLNPARGCSFQDLCPARSWAGPHMLRSQRVCVLPFRLGAFGFNLEIIRHSMCSRRGRTRISRGWLLNPARFRAFYGSNVADVGGYQKAQADASGETRLLPRNGPYQDIAPWLGSTRKSLTRFVFRRAARLGGPTMSNKRRERYMAGLVQNQCPANDERAIVGYGPPQRRSTT